MSRAWRYHASMDRIRVEGLEVECVVGVYPEEREVSQRLWIDLELGLSLDSAARSERVRDSVDYAALVSQLAFLLDVCRFRMLETAGLTLLRYVLAPPAPGGRRAAVEEARVKLAKPDALTAGAVPSVELFRKSSDFEYAVETKPFGSVDVIHETRHVGIYRLNLAPGGVIPLHVHREMDEAEMVLTGGLLCQGEPAALGSIRRWPRETAHIYENPTDVHQSILCVDAPRFIPSDEIEVAGAPAKIRAESGFPLRGRR
jgi:dihydroneopterin aldolase